MRALFTLILVIILIPVILLGGIAAMLYYTYFDVQPAQYPFFHEESEIQSIEYARFVFGDEGLVPEKVGIVLDTEGFMNDLKASNCHTGIEVNQFFDLTNGQPLDGVIINYKDGSFDFITPYLCINSTYNPKGVIDLLNTKVYGYDDAEFAELIDKYGLEISEDILEDFENMEDLEDYLEKNPDLIPQN